MKKILVTGAAGFIGFKTAEGLLKQGKQVVGIDNLNDYYDVRLKRYRLGQLKAYRHFSFYRMDIESLAALKGLFARHKFSAVINLAARAGVRYSLVDPHVYFRTNTNGTVNLLECCKDQGIKKFVLASTSSLYAGGKMPFFESLPVNTPISAYAASKKAAEVVCYTYHYLYNIDVTVLRYFTVYGPAGRPDMSIFRFIKWIDAGKPLELYGDGTQARDFTFVDDIAAGTIKALKPVGFKVINLGGGKRPYKISTVIQMIEKRLGKKAKIRRFDFPKTDMKATWANIARAEKLLKWHPQTGLQEGISKTVDWYLANKSWVKSIKL